MLKFDRRVWTNLRDGFWFVPMVLLAAHVGAGTVLTSTQLADNKEWMARWPHLFGAGADGARGMLSTIAGSMMTVVGVTLSMTLVTLALASSQYTSRILRNFIGDRITQFVLGLFAGIYTYCLIVLRTIRGGDEGGFVPGLAVLLAVILAVVGIIVLIYFIHHIATSIQASNIVAAVAAETISAIERVFPREATSEPDDGAVSAPTNGWAPIMAPADGYIEQIDFPRLEEAARVHDTMVRIECAIGEFVVKGTPLISVVGAKAEVDAVSGAFASEIAIGRHRTVHQDVGFGIRQLVDIALRALSPGINDTTTAIMCVDYLAAILTRLATRAVGENLCSADQVRRVIIAHPSTFARLAGEALDQIREAGGGNFAVLERLVNALDVVGAVSIDAARRQLLVQHLDAVAETAARSIESSTDRERFRSMASGVRERLAADVASYRELSTRERRHR